MILVILLLAVIAASTHLVLVLRNQSIFRRILTR